jgi:sporadic carbohydrate cluster 2OG-Fe(II) oxygenase
MAIEDIESSLTNQGWFIHKAENFNTLEESRKLICDCIRDIHGLEESDDETLLNNIHNLIGNMDDKKANELVVNLLHSLKDKINLGKTVFDNSKAAITHLLGKDIAVQRNQNLVFQYPNSQRYSELHTDAPNNSPYELVYWVPLVNCYGTKSFYLVNKEDTKFLLEEYYQNKYRSWDEFRNKCIELATHLEIEYGEVLGFWSGLLHGSVVNTSNESRMSLNIRYKHLFAPYGKKDPFVFYEPLKISTLTMMALEQSSYE